jgi:hypothetical protein
VDPYGQRAASHDCAPDFRLGSVVRTDGVERYVVEHWSLSLLGCFFYVQNNASLVLATLGAGAMGKLLLVTVGAL